MYTDNKTISSFDKGYENLKNNICEYPRMNIISKLLSKYNIKICKCIKESPINLEYNNILYDIE